MQPVFTEVTEMDWAMKIESQLAEVYAAIQESGASTLEEATAKAEELLEKLRNVTLDIAVTGASGTGKSSFVNAIRGVADDAEEAAPTDPVECTKKPTKYPHPRMPNVNIWDLPGMGTVKFKAAEYLEMMNFDSYDLFVIIVGKRVMENDISLANEIRAKNKNCYIIRSMIEQDVEAEERKGKTEEDTMIRIRQDLEEKFKQFDGFRIFLVSSWFLNRFDFGDLVKVLENDLPENMSNKIFIQSLPVYSMESLDKKYETFKDQIWPEAIGNGILKGLFPLVAEYDIKIMMNFLVKVYYSFGLDAKTLHRLSKRVNKALYVQVHDSKLIKAVAEKSEACLAVELKCSMVMDNHRIMGLALQLIPILGSATLGAVSCTNILFGLRKGLDELYEAAKHVVEMAGLDK